MKILGMFIVIGLLSGCNQANVKDLITDIHEGCVRHYTGSFATGVPANATVTFTIDCQPIPPIVKTEVPGSVQ